MKKPQTLLRNIFGIVLVLLGFFLNLSSLGLTSYFGYNSVGNYLIFCGILIISISFLFRIRSSKKIIDERMEHIGYKASRLTFLFLIFFTFLLMIIDGITKITLPYHIFLSYLICIVLLVYVISYKILERFN